MVYRRGRLEKSRVTEKILETKAEEPSCNSFVAVPQHDNKSVLVFNLEYSKAN